MSEILKRAYKALIGIWINRGRVNFHWSSRDAKAISNRYLKHWDKDDQDNYG